MRHRTSLAMALSAALVGCGTNDDAAQATAAFDRFQRALQRGDEPACRELLTTESRAALADMPWATVREK